MAPQNNVAESPIHLPALSPRRQMLTNGKPRFQVTQAGGMSGSHTLKPKQQEFGSPFPPNLGKVFHYVAQAAGLELLSSSDLPALTSQSAKITDRVLLGCPVEWHYLSSLQLPPPGFKQLSSLSLLKIESCCVAQYGLKLLGSSNPSTLASQNAGITEMESPYVAQASLKFLGLSNPPPLASQNAGIIGISLCAWYK
ncbi:4F2 cell-surface antigen heavy chain, partial [Plecturocebus cupreus]